MAATRTCAKDPRTGYWILLDFASFLRLHGDICSVGFAGVLQGRGKSKDIQGVEGSPISDRNEKAKGSEFHSHSPGARPGMVHTERTPISSAAPSPPPPPPCT